MSDVAGFFNDESTRRQIVWALHYTTDLTQQDIADLEFLDVSQPTVSRIINEYDPARDGFDPTTLSQGIGGKEFEETSEDARENYREAVAKLIAAGPVSSILFKMVENDRDFVST